MLHPELQAELVQARTDQNEYLPNSRVGQVIGQKVLVMVVGPAAIGKTTIMNRAAELAPDFARVPVLCTRGPRPDDDHGMFRTFDHNDANVREILDRIHDGNVVQYAVHPTEDTIYATEPGDYTATFNMLATLSGAVEGMRRLPFIQTNTIGIVSDHADWRAWFDQRFPHSHPDRQKRIKEAKLSLTWLLQDSATLWLHNRKDDVDTTARQFVSIARDQSEPQDLRHEAERMLEEAHRL